MARPVVGGSGGSGGNGNSGISSWISSRQSSAAWYDTSGLTPLLRSNAGAWRLPRLGVAARFDESGSFADASDSITSGIGDFSVTGHVNLNTFSPRPGNRTILGATSGTPEIELRFFATTNWLEFNWHGTPGGTTQARYVLATPENRWAKFAIVREGLTIRLYLERIEDGFAERASATASGASTQAATNLRIGENLGGDLWDLRIHDSALTLEELEAVLDYPYDQIDASGLRNAYWCNEEQGGALFDAVGAADLSCTNVTWVEDTTGEIPWNAANILGYTDNAGVIVPRDESNTSQDVQGNPLEHTGLTQYPAAVHVPYLTGDGTWYAGATDVDLSMLRTGAAECVFNWPAGTGAQNNRLFSLGEGSNRIEVFQGSASGKLTLYALSGGAARLVSTIPEYDDGEDHTLRVEWTDLTITIDGVEPPVTSSGTGTFTEIDFDASETVRLLSYLGGGFVSDMRIGDLKLYDSNGDLSHSWPLQEGAGDTLYDVGPDAVHLATGAGTIDWGNRTALSQDRAITTGGRIGASGECVAAKLDGTAAANGGALSGDYLARPLGRVSDHARIDFNPFDAAELNARISGLYDPTSWANRFQVFAGGPDNSAFAVDGMHVGPFALHFREQSGEQLSAAVRDYGTYRHVPRVATNEAFPQMREWQGKLRAGWRAGANHAASVGKAVFYGSEDDGSAWTKMSEYSDPDSDIDLRDPGGLVFDTAAGEFSAGDWLVLMHRRDNTDGSSGGARCIKSSDGGATWSDLGVMPVPGDRSTYFFPWGRGYVIDGVINQVWYDAVGAYIYTSTDGVTWAHKSTIGSTLNECQIYPLGGSSWLAVSRTSVAVPAGGWQLRYATSGDNMATWSALVDPGFGGVSPDIFGVGDRVFAVVGDRTPGVFGIRLLEYAGGSLIDTGRMLYENPSFANLGYPSAIYRNGLVSMLFDDNSAVDPGIHFLRFSVE